jgi:hypothetical protein
VCVTEGVQQLVGNVLQCIPVPPSSETQKKHVEGEGEGLGEIYLLTGMYN